MEYANFKRVSLKNHPELTERWVQERIAEDPSMVGLGDVILKDKERKQPRAGRLDLLLQDAELTQRYEVDIQLGANDESHIIRTIEYWDIERKRYPQYDHTAVIIAEEMTSRFLNVVSLFNGMIPLVAIQMSALQLDGKVGLVFTTVLDQVSYGLVDEDEEGQESTDRSYWEKRGCPETVRMADRILEMARTFDPSLELKYNKFYIGISKDGRLTLLLRPKKNFIRFETKLKNSPETQERLESAGLDVMDYDARWGVYRLRLRPGEIEQHRDILTDVMRQAFDEGSS